MFEPDPYAPFQDYARPERLVSAPWLSARLGTKGLRVIEVDEDGLLFDIGHIPSATRLKFRQELLDPLTRDIITPEGFTALMREEGINRDDTVVLYGDKSNWWAAFALWIFQLYGHPDVRLLDGGRDAWMSEERDTSFMVDAHPKSDYPAVECYNEEDRIFVDQLQARLEEKSVTLVDTRTPEEFSGQPTNYSPAGDSQYGTTARHGHIPGATNLEWSRAILPNGCFRSLSDLHVAYGNLEPNTPTVLYSHIGAQAAHSWFVLKFLLGFNEVRSYDGSWAEWGNMIKMPVER